MKAACGLGACEGEADAGLHALPLVKSVELAGYRVNGTSTVKLANRAVPRDCIIAHAQDLEPSKLCMRLSSCEFDCPHLAAITHAR